MQKAGLHVIIHGRVQGVFYRASTREKACSLGLKGWVQNLADGSVEAVFEGPVEELHEMLNWCYKGPPGARVTHIDEIWTDYSGNYASFDVRYGW